MKKRTYRRGSRNALTRRSLELGLLLSVIMAATCSALWATGIIPFAPASPLTNLTSRNAGANLKTNPTTDPALQTTANRLSALPTAIPTASFSQNAAIVNATPHTENASSTSKGTSHSANTNTASTSSNSNTGSTNPSPMPTPASANTDPYPPSGTLALDDPLRDNSRGYGWQETSAPSSNGGWACQFIGGTYHAIETQQNGIDSCHANLNASNFTLEVQMTIISGTCGGLVLRDTMSAAHAYSFQVCQDGSYQLYRFDGSSSGAVVQSGSNPTAIKTGLKQTNVIAAVVNGSTFNLYANQQEIASVTDSSYKQGQFGVLAHGTTEVAYTNARMWTI